MSEKKQNNKNNQPKIELAKLRKYKKTWEAILAERRPEEKWDLVDAQLLHSQESENRKIVSFTYWLTRKKKKQLMSKNRRNLKASFENTRRWYCFV